MDLISTIVARKMFASLIENIRTNDGFVAIRRRNKAEALLIPYPQYLSKEVTEITNVNANSSSFDFLNKEPELYSVTDPKRGFSEKNI